MGYVERVQDRWKRMGGGGETAVTVATPDYKQLKCLRKTVNETKIK